MADFCVVDAPGNYANSQLNGSSCAVVHRAPRCHTVLLLDGKDAGREWQILPEHLRPDTLPTNAAVDS